ncbi:hypothetical protein MKX03_029223 [Papaver bracteatum]|nr:hypothetical protein MKX03_029223 [Papaver bracteatum]
MGNWKWFSESGSWGFKSSSTAEQVTEGIDATGLTAIVTGATSGIGKEIARVLALRGVNVIIPSRDLENGLKIKEMILQENPKAQIDVMEMDLASIESITSFAQSFNSSKQSLNILINNAGIFACPFQLSRDGIELQFATNHLGHFLLTKLLMEKLKTTTKKTSIEGRIVNVSSTAHGYSKGILSVIFFFLFPDQNRYQKYDAYCRSKLANVLHANELSRVLQAEEANVTENSLHPGIIATNIFRFMNIRGIMLHVLASLGKLFTRIYPNGKCGKILPFCMQGASTTCYLGLHPDLKGVTGKYFIDCKETLPSSQSQDKDLG